MSSGTWAAPQPTSTGSATGGLPMWTAFRRRLPARARWRRPTITMTGGWTCLWAGG
ncbi:MAG TPA: hypothetical protein VE868_12785 [Balneolaceae bacterium]|nr:hypothetical protein [Balneolaceae bacterium]